MHYKKSVFRSLAMVSQLGISVMTPIFLCIFIGHYIDSHFGTSLLVPFLILGVLTGGRCGWIMAKKTLDAEKRDDEREILARHQARPNTGIQKPKTPSRVLKEADIDKEKD